MPSLYQMTKFHSNKAYQQSAVVELFKKSQYYGDDLLIHSAVRNALLLGVGLKIGIPDFKADTSSKFVAAA
jgi:hypothetical protein